MAKKKSGYKRMKKQEPAVLTMRFAPITVPANGISTETLDISQCASLLNRRFYRQGINWAVAGIKILASSGDSSNRAEGYVSINKLPSTWVMANSWMKSFSAWQRMNREALAETESVRPKFLDFKIYADSVHHSAGYGDNLLPASGQGGVAAPGEWESSKMIVPKSNGTDDVSSFEVIATGASYPGVGASGFNAVSAIEGYAASRGLPNILDPNTPDDSRDASGTNPENWMAALFNDGTEQTDVVLSDMTLENNLAPYPFENDGVNTDTMYPNGANQLVGLQFHDDSYITSSTIGGHTRLKGGQFPCGLMRINVINTTPEASIDYSIQVDLVPGSHRGYLCETMTEM